MLEFRFFRQKANPEARVRLLLVAFFGLVLPVPEFAYAHSERIDPGNYCVVPIERGEATEADVYQAHRIVHWVRTFPTELDLIVAGLNRDGLWTLSDNLEWQFVAARSSSRPRHFSEFAPHPSGNGWLALDSHRLVWFRSDTDPKLLFTLPRDAGKIATPILSVPEWDKAYFISGRRLYRIDSHNAVTLIDDPPPIANRPFGDFRLFFDWTEGQVVAVLNGAIFTIGKGDQIKSADTFQQKRLGNNFPDFWNFKNSDERQFWRYDDHPFANVRFVKRNGRYLIQDVDERMLSIEGLDLIINILPVSNPVWISRRRLLLLTAGNGLFAVVDRRTKSGHFCDILQATPVGSKSIVSRPVSPVGVSLGGRNSWSIAERKDGTILLVAKSGLYALGKGEIEFRRMRLPSEVNPSWLSYIAPMPDGENAIIGTHYGSHKGHFVLKLDGSVVEVKVAWFGTKAVAPLSVLHSRGAILYARGQQIPYAVTPDFRLIRMDAPIFGDPIDHVVDLPTTKEIVVANSQSLCELIGIERLQCLKFPGMKDYRQSPRIEGLYGLPRRGQVIVSTHRGVYLYESGRVTKVSDIAFRILSILDRGSDKAALLGTSRGLFQLSPQGQMRATRHTGKYDLGAVRVLSEWPGTDDIVLGTDGGLWVLKADGRVFPVNGPENRMIGAIYEIRDIPWWDAKLVRSRLGILILHHDGKLERLTTDGTSQVREMPHIFEIEKRVLAEANGQIFEFMQQPAR